MGNQESQDQNKVEASSNKRRRFLQKAGVAAPVVLTLSSPSVFGIGCLSQQLSGNLSHPGNSCVKGNSPSFWKLPANMNLWPLGFSYGTLQTTGNPDPGLCSSYSGGTPFNDSNAFGGTNTLPLREILCTNDTSLDSYFIAAMLNAKAISGYVLTPTQVLDLYNNTTPIPAGYADINAFLASTW